MDFNGFGMQSIVVHCISDVFWWEGLETQGNTTRYTKT